MVLGGLVQWVLSFVLKRKVPAHIFAANCHFDGTYGPPQRRFNILVCFCLLKDFVIGFVDVHHFKLLSTLLNKYHDDKDCFCSKAGFTCSQSQAGATYQDGAENLILSSIVLQFEFKLVFIFC